MECLLNHDMPELAEDEFYWLRLMEERGHASVFARKTSEDLAIVERCTAMEWAHSVRSKYGLQVERVRSNADQNKAPDCFAFFEGREVGVELTELVDGSLLARIRQGRERGHRLSASSGREYWNAQWGEARFISEVSKLFQSKAEEYRKNGDKIDVLIICTGEPWLSPEQVEAWLPSWEVRATDEIASLYSLMSYFPGYLKRWPVFRVF